MDRTKRRTWPLWLLLTLAALLVLPYLLPLSAPADISLGLPFDNSAFLEIEGTRFHYRLYLSKGQAARGKLLLVHGLGASTYSFEALVPQLTQAGYLVVSVDLPGFGYSERSLSYDHSQGRRASDLWLLLDQVDAALPEEWAQKPWHLGGHSMGGGTVYAMALKRPDSSRSLLLLDAPLTADRGSGRALFTLPPLMKWLEVGLEHLLFNEARIDALLKRAYGRLPTKDEVQGYLAPLLLPGTARSLGQFVRTAREEDIRGLARLPLPVFFIWGGEDTIVPIAILHKLQALRPDAQALVIPGAGHCPMETHTGEVAEALIAWLADDRPAFSVVR